MIIAVKAYQNQRLAEELAQLDPFPEFLVCFQNGLDIEQPFFEVLGKDRIIRVLAHFAGNQLDTGETQFNFFYPPNHAGLLEPFHTDALHEFCDLLTQCHLETQPVTDLPIWVWKKLILNSALSALSAITKATTAELLQEPVVKEIARLVMAEGVATAQAHGIDLSDDFCTEAFHYLVKIGNHLPALAVDIINGNPTEVDYLYGKIVTIAEQSGISVPYNRLFRDILHLLQQFKSVTRFKK